MEKLLLIVEGEGDKKAMPCLARRVLNDKFNIFNTKIVVQKRKELSHLKCNDWAHLKKYLRVALLENCPILWTIDLDDGCPVEEVIEMCRVISSQYLTQPIAVAFWVKEFETMYIYEFENVRNQLDVDVAIQVDLPADPDGKRDAKGWITRQMPYNRIYKETLHQQQLVFHINIENLLVNYRSFIHFHDCIGWLVNQDAPAVYPQ